MNKRIWTIFILILSIITFILGILIQNMNVALVGIVLLIFYNVIISFFDIKNRMVFLVFNITFFVLNVGGNFFSMLLGKDWSNGFSNEVLQSTLLIIYLGIFTLLIGAFLFELRKKHKTEAKKEGKKPILKPVNIEYVRKFSKIFFIITVCLASVITIEKLIFVQQNGYVSLYTGFHSIFPSFLKKIADTNLIFFLIYICTFPSKKETLITIGIYGVYLALTLFTGVRGTTVVAVLMILIYLVYRQSYNKEEKYFTKKTIPFLAICAIVFIVFLGAYNTLRNGMKIENFNFFDQFVQFFVDQNTTGKVISYVEEYKDQLPDTNVSYTFGPFISYVRQGTIAQILGIDGTHMKFNTEEMALYGNDLGSTISYLVLGEQYLNGFGIGTQYMAEVYADFSYWGVMIYNLLLGMILMALTNIRKENWIGMTYSFFIISMVIYLPRQPALAWVVNLLSIPNILSIILIYLLAFFYSKKSKMLEMEQLNEDSLDH